MYGLTVHGWIDCMYVCKGPLAKMFVNFLGNISHISRTLLPRDCMSCMSLDTGRGVSYSLAFPSVVIELQVPWQGMRVSDFSGEELTWFKLFLQVTVGRGITCAPCLFLIHLKGEENTGSDKRQAK